MKVSNRDRAAIRSVIENQLLAFQQDDAQGAFAVASPGIREQFGTAENFMQMVKTAYLAVYRPRSVLFEDLATYQGIPAQPLLLLDPDGLPVRAIYLMEKQEDNSWRVCGCYLLPAGLKEM